jgi:FPC/CPF motif-containing protein YcgG
MITVEVSDWTTRVLDHNLLGITPRENWKVKAYQQYKAKLCAAEYPCFFGQTGELRGEMMYTFVSRGALIPLADAMQRFVSLLAALEYARCSLVTFFEPDESLSDHAGFLNRFWKILQFLHELDPQPAELNPEHPLWEFSFARCEMFAVGASPTYSRRRSRNLGSGMVIIFQPRILFIDPATAAPIAAEVRQRIHKRMLAYDGMAVHPDIGFYGQHTNREWKQYALPDDNSPERGHCPFHARNL